VQVHSLGALVYNDRYTPARIVGRGLDGPDGALVDVGSKVRVIDERVTGHRSGANSGSHGPTGYRIVS